MKQPRKRRKVYRLLCLMEDTLSVFRKWYEKFTPEWEEEEQAEEAANTEKDANDDHQ